MTPIKANYKNLYGELNVPNLLDVMLDMVADDLFQMQRRPAALDIVVDKANIVRRPVPVEFADSVAADMGPAIDLMADTVIVLSRYLTEMRKAWILMRIEQVRPIDKLNKAKNFQQCLISLLFIFHKQDIQHFPFHSSEFKFSRLQSRIY